jgi:hypothetical protein
MKIPGRTPKSQSSSKGGLVVKRILTLFFGLILVGSMMTPTVLAEAHRFDLLRKGLINGVELKPGRYTLELDGDNLGRIRQGKKLLVEVSIEVLPIGGAMPQSVSQFRDGRVKEIRLKEKRVVFVDTDASAQTAR